jgi:hypothetical protein
MKQYLAKTLLALSLAATSILAQAGSYEVTSKDVSGQVLLARWASSEGKLSRWYAPDYFDLSKRDAEQLNVKLKNANSFSEAVGVLISEGNQIRAGSDKMRFKACVFNQGDVAVVVFDLTHTGCLN